MYEVAISEKFERIMNNAVRKGLGVPRVQMSYDKPGEDCVIV